MVAQLVERKLPKLEVAGSTPVRRLVKQPANARILYSGCIGVGVFNYLGFVPLATTGHNAALHQLTQRGRLVPAATHRLRVHTQRESGSV